MKKKIYFLGFVGGIVYNTVASIKSFGTAISLREVRVEADAKFNQANDLWNVANNNYKDKASTLTHLQQESTDLHCVIDDYDAFNRHTDNFCAKAQESQDPEAYLSISYGIHFERVPNAIEETTRTIIDQKCSNSYNKEACSQQIYQTTFKINGALVRGPGSRSLRECNSYTTGLEINPELTSDTNDQWKIIDATHETRTISYKSSMKVNLYTDSKTASFTIACDLDPETYDFKFNAMRMLETIGNQCRVLKRSRQPINYYKDLLNQTENQIPPAALAMNQSLNALQPLVQDRAAKLARLQESQNILDQEVLKVFGHLLLLLVCTVGAATLIDQIQNDNANTPRRNDDAESRVHELEEEDFEVGRTEGNPALLNSFGSYRELDAQEPLAETVTTCDDTHTVPEALVVTPANRMVA